MKSRARNSSPTGSWVVKTEATATSTGESANQARRGAIASQAVPSAPWGRSGARVFSKPSAGSAAAVVSTSA